MGGGSLEINLANNGYTTAAGDVYRPVANFWQVVLDANKNRQMRDLIREMETVDEATYRDLRKRHTNEQDPVKAAAWFWIVNNHTFSGLLHHDRARYNERSRHALADMDYLANYVGLPLTVAHCDFAKLLKDPTDDAFVFADPPYFPKPGTEKKQVYAFGLNAKFDHARLKRYLERHKYYLITYDDGPQVRALYAGHAAIKSSYVWRAAHHQKGKKMPRAGELCIISPALAEACPSLASDLINIEAAPLAS